MTSKSDLHQHLCVIFLKFSKIIWKFFDIFFENFWYFFENFLYFFWKYFLKIFWIFLEISWITALQKVKITFSLETRTLPSLSQTRVGVGRPETRHGSTAVCCNSTVNFDWTIFIFGSIWTSSVLWMSNSPCELDALQTKTPLWCRETRSIVKVPNYQWGWRKNSQNFKYL